MTNISIFLQVLKTNNFIAILNANTEVIDDTLYIQYICYEKLRKILGEQTLDTLLHDVYHTPYAAYFASETIRQTYNPQKCIYCFT